MSGRTCPNCGEPLPEWKPNHARHCSQRCATQAYNRRYYAEHREELNAKATERQRRQRAAKRERAKALAEGRPWRA